MWPKSLKLQISLVKAFLLELDAEEWNVQSYFTCTESEWKIINVKKLTMFRTRGWLMTEKDKGRVCVSCSRSSYLGLEFTDNLYVIYRTI